jgi:hypothetical protein
MKYSVGVLGVGRTPHEPERAGRRLEAESFRTGLVTFVPRHTTFLGGVAGESKTGDNHVGSVDILVLCEGFTRVVDFEQKGVELHPSTFLGDVKKTVEHRVDGTGLKVLLLVAELLAEVKNTSLFGLVNLLRRLVLGINHCLVSDELQDDVVEFHRAGSLIVQQGGCCVVREKVGDDPTFLLLDKRLLRERKA